MTAAMINMRPSEKRRAWCISGEESILLKPGKQSLQEACGTGTGPMAEGLKGHNRSLHCIHEHREDTIDVKQCDCFALQKDHPGGQVENDL